MKDFNSFASHLPAVIFCGAQKRQADLTRNPFSLVGVLHSHLLLQLLPKLLDAGGWRIGGGRHHCNTFCHAGQPLCQLSYTPTLRCGCQLSHLSTKAAAVEGVASGEEVQLGQGAACWAS